MIFTFLLFTTALFIEGIGTYISILGLSALFAGSKIVITMAVALDVGKVVAVSFLYKNFKRLGFLMQSYLFIACFVLMLITSVGVFGYLSGEFQKAIASNSTQTVLLNSLEEEKTRLLERKADIDGQIAALPEKYTAFQRTRAIREFKQEQREVTVRLTEIDKELPALKIETIGKDLEIGPVLYVASAFKTTPELAVKWIILVIIFVFDPLAIALLIGGNFLLARRAEEKAATKTILSSPKYIPDPVEEEFQRDLAAREQLEREEKLKVAEASHQRMLDELERAEQALKDRPSPVDDFDHSMSPAGIHGHNYDDMLTPEVIPASDAIQGYSDQHQELASAPDEPDEPPVITLESINKKKPRRPVIRSSLEDVDLKKNLADIQVDNERDTHTAVTRLYGNGISSPVEDKPQ